MSAVVNINPEKEPIPRSWIPRVITGGKEPPDGTGRPPIDMDWLCQLDLFTVFICRANHLTVDFELYTVEYSGPDFTLLKWHLGDGRYWERRVDTLLFSTQHRDYKVVGVFPPTQEEPPTAE